MPPFLKAFAIPQSVIAFNQKKNYYRPKIWFTRGGFYALSAVIVSTGRKFHWLSLFVLKHDIFMMTEGKHNKILFIEIIIEARKINLNWGSFVFGKFLFTSMLVIILNYKEIEFCTNKLCGQ